MTAVAIQHREEIIEQLALGKLLSDIAPSLCVSPNALSKALKSDPEYRDAIAAGFHKRLDDAEASIEGAAEQVDVARARARFQSVAWRAEREFPDRWASQSHVSVDVSFSIAPALMRAEQRERDIAGERVADMPNGAMLPPISTDTSNSNDA